MKLKSRLVLLLLVALAIFVAVLAWFQRSDGQWGSHRSSTDKAALAPVAEENLSGSGGANDVADTRRDSQTSTVERFPAMAMLNTSRSARAFHDELRKHIDDGDIAALAALDELQSRCGSISSAQGRQYAEHDVSISKSDDEFEARRVALNALTAFCDRPYAPGELKAEMKLVEEAMRAAAAKGDETAMIWLAVHMGEAANSELMLRHLTSRDPWVAEMALLGLSGANDSRVKAVRERVFSDWRGSSASSEIETIVLAAAKWRACDLGLPCGPGGYYQHYQCLYGGGYCEPSLGVKDYIRRQLSGRQYEAMLRYVESLDALAKSTP